MSITNVATKQRDVGFGEPDPGLRAMFFRLENFEDDASLLAQALDHATNTFAVTPTDDHVGLQSSVAAIGAEHLTRLQHAIGHDAALCTTPLLHGCAPSLILDGAWLQFASRPLDGHTAASSALLGFYLHEVTRHGHRGELFRDMMRSLGDECAPTTAWAFAADPVVIEASLSTANLWLSASQYPGRFAPELVGLTLFAAARGPHPLLVALAPDLRRRAGDLRHLDAVTDPGRIARAPALAEGAAQFALEAAGAGRERFALGIARGLAAGQGLLDREVAALVARAHELRAGPRAAMGALIRRKAPFARGYHGAQRLAGDPLDVWFAAAEQDIDAFLDALAASPYVRPGDPERSRLLTTAIAPRGRMAGIFDAAEQVVIRAWIVDLGPGRPGHAIAPVGAPSPVTAPLPEIILRPVPPPRHEAPPLRELYWRLLHIEDHPDLRPHARNFAASWLARAGAGLEKGERAIPLAQYDPAGLQNWLERQHAVQVASYPAHGLDPTSLPSRAAVIEDAVQLCPMVLIDGAWLQRSGQLSFCGTRIGRLLHRIYLDEVGDGDVRENHPNVYRELMEEMGVELPSFGSRAFAEWDGFRDAAFAVPTFWLSVSLFPRHFMPEILGLNLAMELSGVGGTYRASRDALRHHGFSSAFVDLHNTVDNASTGHSAMALEAITAHLQDMLEAGGRDEVQRRWRRVWTGYRALTPPPGTG